MQTLQRSGLYFVSCLSKVKHPKRPNVSFKEFEFQPAFNQAFRPFSAPDTTSSPASRCINNRSKQLHINEKPTIPRDPIIVRFRICVGIKFSLLGWCTAVCTYCTMSFKHLGSDGKVCWTLFRLMLWPNLHREGATFCLDTLVNGCPSGVSVLKFVLLDDADNRI